MSDADAPTADDRVTPDSPGDDVPEQFRIRQGKRQRLLEQVTSLPGCRAAHGIAGPGQSRPPRSAPDTATGEIVGVTGRVVFARNSGKLCFATLQEGDGVQLQAMISLAGVGEEALQSWKTEVDLGDIVFVHGEVISSRRGELSVLADSWQMAAKALRAAGGPQGDERGVAGATTLRRPHRPSAGPHCCTPADRRRPRGPQRSGTRGFLEVETPMLQTLAGGAAARPFVTPPTPSTPISTCGSPGLFLRKRCVVGGLEKVFELNRGFRNEGADSTHSPEFAMLETYEAWGTYDDSAVMIRELIQGVADEAIGTRQVPLPDGTVYDLDGEWPSIKCIRHCPRPSARSRRDLR